MKTPGFAPAVLGPWLTALTLMATCLPSASADLSAYTEDWPPYNFQDNGRVRGIATDLLREACAQAHLQCSIELVPWARAYKTASMEPNTLVYTTARKPSREEEFLWVGPILPRTTWVYLRNARSVRAQTVAELGRLRVGVVRDEASRQDLLAQGLPERALVEHATNADLLKLLRAGAIDAMVDTEVGMQWSLRAQHLPAHTVRAAFKLSDEGAYYYALNRQTAPERVHALQAAVDQLRANGQLQKIVAGYGAQARP